MSKDYSEDQLIQKSAADLLENELGWPSVMAWDAEVLGETGAIMKCCLCAISARH